MAGYGGPERGRERRVRLDMSGTGASRLDADTDGYSGRAVVACVVVGVLVLWGGLNLTFRQWRAHYRERAAYGVEHVANVVQPLARVVPVGDVSPVAWREAVAETRKMLVTLTAANLLDRPQLEALGGRVAAQVADARPETARSALAAIWDEAEDHAGPVVDRHPRPPLLPPRVVKDGRWVVRRP